MLFQSNLRKQIRKLPKILNFVKIIPYYSKFFTGVLILDTPEPLEDSLATRGFDAVASGLPNSFKNQHLRKAPLLADPD